MTSEGGKFYSLLLPRLPRRDTPGIAVGEKLRLAKSHQPDFPVTLRWYGAATKAAWAGNSAESCNSQQIFGTSILGLSRTTIHGSALQPVSCFPPGLPPI